MRNEWIINSVAFFLFVGVMRAYSVFIVLRYKKLLKKHTKLSDDGIEIRFPSIWRIILPSRKLSFKEIGSVKLFGSFVIVRKKNGLFRNQLVAARIRR